MEKMEIRYIGMETITVSELIKVLADADPNAKVVFTSNYGDRNRTQQAHGIHGDLRVRTLKESAYSESGYAVRDTWDYGEGETVLVIQ